MASRPGAGFVTSEVGRPSWQLFRPFSFVTVVGFASALLPPYQGFHPVPIMLALVTLGASGVALCISMGRAERTWLAPMAAYLLFVVVALAREALGGGSSGLSALVLVPLLWLALTGTRNELWIASALAAAVFLLPLALEPDNYPAAEWRRAFTWAIMSAFLAPLVQRAVQQLQAARERATRLFEESPHGIAILQRDGSIASANAALVDLLGRSESRLVGTPLAAYAPPGSDEVDRHLAPVFAGERAAATGHAHLRDDQGNDVPVSLRSKEINGGDGTTVILVNVVDVSEQRRYELRLTHLAEHDVLTGLSNRRLFQRELELHEGTCSTHGSTGALLLLDLDHFKEVNDTLGHGAGDELLVDLAGILRSSVRSHDTVARLGGDEFAVLLPDGDRDDAAAVAERIVTSVRNHAATLDGVPRRLTASIGVVTFAAAQDHETDILALADMTMYDAKEAGRDQFSVLEEGTQRPPRIGARLKWQERIEAAVANDGFVLHFQPIMDITTGRIVSAEALLRLADEPGELVPPSRFLYIAEAVGLAPALDSWVVRKSVAELARLRRTRPDFALEVNLSGHSIGSERVEATIREALAEHDLDPAALVLEVTETSAVSDVREARAFAERLSALGCKFALDDFGAGFGSFYYLKHLTFDYVKIDGEFVSHVDTSSVDRTILRSIVGIAHDLGKRTVAEFVSSPEILDVVRAEGVDLAQGFLIGKPVPIQQFIDDHLLSEHSLDDRPEA